MFPDRKNKLNFIYDASIEEYKKLNTTEMIKKLEEDMESLETLIESLEYDTYDFKKKKKYID